MHIVFVDTAPKDYHVLTPFERPLGGSQSAFCYLAAALAKRGHQVTLLTHTSTPQHALHVDCRNLPHSIRDVGKQHVHAVVLLNGPARMIRQIRRDLPHRTPAILWSQHAADQPAMQELQNHSLRHDWDRIVCVSDWHRSNLVDTYHLDPDKVSVLRNAISPAFERLFASTEQLLEAKSPSCILTYTSTPFRGLGVLLSLFPVIHNASPEVELHVYSSMKVYDPDPERDPFANLYERSRQLAGVRYVGSIPQPQLAEALTPMSILAYPNTFAETSCIAVMEAMAAGLFVVTTDLAALPETTMGFAELVEPVGLPDDSRAFALTYGKRLHAIIRRWQHDPKAFAASRFEQVQTVNTHCTWAVRAQQWETLLLQLNESESS